MPPKKARSTENADSEFEVLHGLEGPSSETEPKVTRRRATPRQGHAAIVLAIDVGSTSSIKSVPDETESDLQRSLQIADWIVSRKLFTDSKDQFSLVFFGHECTTDDNYSNVYVHNAEFERARVEWLHVFKNEVQTNPKCPGDYLAALFASLEQLKIHGEVGKDGMTEATVTLISNFGGLNEDDQVFEVLDSVVEAFNAVGAKLLIMYHGPDLNSSPISKSQQLGIEFVRSLLPKMDVLSYNFQESLSKLKFFIPKSLTPRGQPFNFELGKDFSVRVQLYVKNQEVVLQERFDPVSFSSTSTADRLEQPQILKKIRRYETVADHETSIPLAAIDSTPDISFTSTSTINKALSTMPSGKLVQKEDIVRGYRYGSTIVTFDKAIQMISPRYILPHKDGKGSVATREADLKSFNTLSAIVNAMLKKGVVALCRYAYNIASNPRLSCLIPKITKKENYPILIHYLMPFRDDFHYQKDLIDEYINNLMLCDSDGGNELLKKRSIHDPRIQHQCMTLREKALNPGKPIELSYEDKRALLQMLEPPKHLLEKSKHVISTMKGEFSLQVQINKSVSFQNSDGNVATPAENQIEVSQTTGDNVNRLKPILNALMEEKKKLENERQRIQYEEFDN
uniref:Ku domain-containing protein n=1 Tax=Meloidogyne javanica TaxID=6303 RepID=A0A915LW12_MELJA